MANGDVAKLDGDRIDDELKVVDEDHGDRLLNRPDREDRAVFRLAADLADDGVASHVGQDVKPEPMPIRPGKHESERLCIDEIAGEKMPDPAGERRRVGGDGAVAAREG